MVWASNGSSAIASSSRDVADPGEQANEGEDGEEDEDVSDEDEHVPDLEIAVGVGEAGRLVEEAGDVVRELARTVPATPSNANGPTFLRSSSTPHSFGAHHVRPPTTPRAAP